MTSSLSFRTGRSVEFGRVLFALVLVSACGSFSFAPAIWAQTAHAGGATIALGGGFGGGAYTGPVGVAVDGSGNVYVAILEASLVKKIPPGCGDSSCVQTLGGG